MVFLGLSKAIDVANHRLLLAKMEALSIYPAFQSWEAASLSHGQMRVRVIDDISLFVPIASAVPRGSISGPILNLPYIHCVSVNCLRLMSFLQH